jgi:hypothetical protein
MSLRVSSVPLVPVFLPMLELVLLDEAGIVSSPIPNTKE